MNREQARRVAIKSARVQGCTCDVEVRFIGGGHVELAHDDWCPLVRVMEERPPGARTQGVIYEPEEEQ